MTNNKHKYSTIALLLILALGLTAIVSADWDDCGTGWICMTNGDKVAANPYYYHINDESNYIEHNETTNHTYLNQQGNLLITKNNKTQWGDIYAGTAVFNNLITTNLTTQQVTDYNITGNINATGDITTDGAFRTTSDKGLIYTNLQDVWAFTYDTGLGVDNTGVVFNVTTSEFQYKILGLNLLRIEGSSATGNSWYGTNTNTYQNIKFNYLTASNDGYWEWDRGNDRFEYNDSILLENQEPLYFDDQFNYIRENNNYLQLVGTTGIHLGQGTVGLDPIILIHGQDNNATITWKEDENQLNIENDVNITGNLTANHIYGNRWFNNMTGSTETIISASNTWTNITGFLPTQTDNNGYILNGLILNSEGLNTTISGTYKIDYSLSFERSSGGTAREYNFAIMKNGIIQNNTFMHRLVGNANDVGAGAVNTFMQINNGDNIRLVVKNTGGTENVGIHAINFNIQHIAH